MGLWSLNVKGKKQGMEKFLFFYFFAAKSCENTNFTFAITCLYILYVGPVQH